MVHGLLGKTARVAATGLAGAVAYDGVKRVARSRLIRDVTVTGTAWGLRGFRAAEARAEKARLAAGDIVSEARERIGEQAPAPGAFKDHDHGHEH